ncbi:MAG: membrane protein insertion efficiency factor YidD [Clostridia bacterium]|nr:membrane protein insertion efficiency factor YidD [Clostridia bacterium]
MKHIMIWLVRLYRKYISPLKPNCCRFTPTCSQYALQAFEKRGFFVGMALTVWRILRCNPFSRGGYDPVPERGSRAARRRAKDEIEEPTNKTEKESQDV